MTAILVIFHLVLSSHNQQWYDLSKTLSSTSRLSSQQQTIPANNENPYKTPLQKTFHFSLSCKEKIIFNQNWNDTLLSILFQIIYFKQLAETGLNQLCLTLKITPLWKNCLPHRKEASPWDPLISLFFPKSFPKRTITSKCRRSRLRLVDGFDSEENNSRDSKVF